MTTKNYLIGIKGRSLSNCYREFFNLYKDSMAIFSHNNQFYDIKNTCIYLRNIDKNEIEYSLKSTNLGNLTFIGEDKKINQILNEIKSKGFFLEEIPEIREKTRIEKSLESIIN